MKSLRSYFDDLAAMVRARPDSDEEQRGGFLSGHYTAGQIKMSSPANDEVEYKNLRGSLGRRIAAESGWAGRVIIPDWRSEEAKIGTIESTGEHKGEIYGGIYPGDNKPIWFSEEPKPMSHYDAVALKDRALPTSEQGKYIETIKGKGALKDIFARHSDSSSLGGYFWLAEHGNLTARHQQFNDGSQDYYGTDRLYPLPVLSVRR